MRLNRCLSVFVLLTTVNFAPLAAFADNGFHLPPAEPLPGVADPNKAVWSLPITGRLDGSVEMNVEQEPESKQTKSFDASVSALDAENAVSSRIDSLLESALARDPQSRVFTNAVAHYRTKTQRVIAETKDTVDYLIPYRGFGPSSEAGDIILGEQVKLKSRASAEYARQRHIDETHVKVVASMMQLAMGLGTSDKDKSAAIVAQGYSSMKDLVGQEETDRTMEMLNTWMKEVQVPDSVYNQGVWDVAKRQDQLKTVITTALEQDAVLHEITKRIHKYNQRSKFARASAHIVETSLGVAALTPTFVGPAAKAALTGFVMATGGPESCKLLKELYLDKRFESRWKVLNEEAHLALENYHIGILTKNPVLIATSESLIDQMAGDEIVRKVLGTTVLPKQAVAAKATTAL